MYVYTRDILAANGSPNFFWLVAFLNHLACAQVPQFLHMVSGKASASQAEPSLGNIQVRRHRVPNTHSPNSFHVRAEIVSAVVLLRRVRLGRSRRGADAKYIRPLLHSLLVIVWRKSGIHGSVPELHAWPSAVVAGVHFANHVPPGISRCYAPAAGTSAVPRGSLP